MQKVFLKKGKERIVLQNRHPWIFSGAIEQFPKNFIPGDLASVHCHAGNFLALAYFHPGHSLAGRILSYEQKPCKQILKEKIRSAFTFRKSLFSSSSTNCFRCVNAEEDGLPGLILDVYDNVVVVQINTLGMERLRDLLLEVIIEELKPSSIYEKSTSSSRELEGLSKEEGLLYGEKAPLVEVVENGVRFLVSIEEGQKTGLFLDQREMRKKIGELAKGKRVLNCFSYSGGFSLYALQGGANHVVSVDLCKTACQLARQNTELNGFTPASHSIMQGDVFTFLEETDLSQFDLIILDPPAFAKKRQDVEMACKGYRQLMEKVLQNCKEETLLLTCSCSYFVDETLFQQLVFQAASPTARDVQILSRHIRAADHPVSLYHPEGEYLKSLLLRVI